MEKPKEVLDSYYLDAKLRILEIAAMLDRYDRACEETMEPDCDVRILRLYDSLSLLLVPEMSTDRIERLLNLHSDLQ